MAGRGGGGSVCSVSGRHGGSGKIHSLAWNPSQRYPNSLSNTEKDCLMLFSRTTHATDGLVESQEGGIRYTQQTMRCAAMRIYDDELPSY